MSCFQRSSNDVPMVAWCTKKTWSRPAYALLLPATDRPAAPLSRCVGGSVQIGARKVGQHSLRTEFDIRSQRAETPVSSSESLGDDVHKGCRIADHGGESSTALAGAADGEVGPSDPAGVPVVISRARPAVKGYCGTPLRSGSTVDLDGPNRAALCLCARSGRQLPIWRELNSSGRSGTRGAQRPESHVSSRAIGRSSGTSDEAWARAVRRLCFRIHWTRMTAEAAIVMMMLPTKKITPPACVSLSVC